MELLHQSDADWIRMFALSSPQFNRVWLQRSVISATEQHKNDGSKILDVMRGIFTILKRQKAYDFQNVFYQFRRRLLG